MTTAAYPVNNEEPRETHSLVISGQLINEWEEGQPGVR